MYNPRDFLENRPQTLWNLMRAHPFATVVVVDEGLPQVAFAPMLVEGGRLRFHLARANRVSELLSSGARATVLFHGPHAYVSPRFYEQPDRQVPTWNYAVVQASGVARTVEGEAMRELLGAISARFEGDRADAWTLGQVAEHRVDGMMRAIVGFELAAPELEGKFKLSQNRSETDRARVLERLAERAEGDDLAVVALMKER